jgi:NADH-quinone oxidoreductase subunit N
VRTVVLVPEAVVLGAAVALVLAGRLRRPLIVRAAALVLAVVALALELWLGAAVGTLFQGGWQQDRFALFAKAALLLGLTVLVASTADADAEDEASWGSLPLAFAFVVVFGGMVAASATSLVALWVGLELAALAAVAAVGLGAREMGARLLVLASVAAALVALGFGVLYAMAGSPSLAALRTGLRPGSVSIPLAFAVLVTLTGVLAWFGLGPAQSAVVEDEDGGAAPVSAAALGGLLVGVAAVVAAKLLGGLDAVNTAWTPWLSVLAAFAMVFGGLRAMASGSPRAMTAWLIVAQVGWVAAGLAVHDRRGSAAALLLLGALLLAAVAAPVLAGPAQVSARLAGWGRMQPVRAAGLALVLLSLAGAPPLAGFLGQVAVAAELIRSNQAWMLAAGLLGSLLALAGVVRLILVMYLEAGPEQVRPARARGAPAWWSVGLLAPAVFVVLYSLFANPISGLALQGAAALKLP